MCIRDSPKRSAAKYPDLTSLVFMGNKITFAELNRNCCRMARVFESLGAKKGDRISFITHNCLTYIYSWLGACKIGCVANPLNFQLKPKEIEYIINNAGSRFLFVEDLLVPQALEAAPDLKSVEKNVNRLRKHTNLPIAVGFGVKTAAQARAIARSADGVVVGSALVSAIKDSLTKAGKPSPKTVKAVHSLVSDIARGVRS